MVTKNQAIAFAKEHNWTEADAKRAYVDVDFKTATEQDILLALINFSGPELRFRQSSQGRYKGEVTKKNNEIERINKNYQIKIKEGEREIHEMRSTFIPVIQRIYTFAQKFGLQDDWIEALLETYDSYQNQEIS